MMVTGKTLAKFFLCVGKTTTIALPMKRAMNCPLNQIDAAKIYLNYGEMNYTRQVASLRRSQTNRLDNIHGNPPIKHQTTTM